MPTCAGVVGASECALRAKGASEREYLAATAERGKTVDVSQELTMPKGK